MSLSDHKKALATEVLAHLGESGILRHDDKEIPVRFRLYSNVESIGERGELKLVERMIGLADTVSISDSDVIISDGASYKLGDLIDTSGGLRRYIVKMR